MQTVNTADRAWLRLNGQVSNLEHAVSQRDQYKSEVAKLRRQVGILKACVEGIANNHKDAIWQDEWFTMRDNAALVLAEAAREGKQ